MTVGIVSELTPPTSLAPGALGRSGVEDKEVDVVLSGGATNCVQLTSAAYELGKYVRIARIGGSSAGGLGALGKAFDVPEDAILSLFIDKLSGNKLLDRNALNFYEHMGLCRGDALRKAIGSIVGDDTKMRHAKIPLFCMVSDLYAATPLCVASWSHPDALVCDVGTTTCAVPGLFGMQEIRGLDLGNRKFCDGGLARNFAMNIFDDEPGRVTVGIRVRQPPSIDPVRQGDVGAWARAVGRLFLWSSDNAHLSTKSRMVLVEVPAADGFDFSLTRQEVLRRWALGKEAARAALSQLM